MNKIGKGLVAGAKEDAGSNDWQAKDDLHTLLRAHEIKSDKGRHAAAMKHGKQKLKEMQAMMSAGKNTKADPDAANESNEY